MEALAIPFLLLVGALLAVQAAANVQLSAAMASPFGASTLQLGIGAAVLLALAARRRVARRVRPARRRRAAGRWSAASAARSTSPPASCCSRGSARSSPSACSSPGRCSASLLLDGFGWLGVARDAPGVAALAGAAAVVAGTGLIVRAQAGAEALEGRRGRAGLARARRRGRRGAARAGCDQRRAATPSSTPRSRSARSRSWSRPRRWRSRSAAPSPPARRRPRVAPLRGVPWWGWLGGLCGATYVTAVFLLIPEIGAAPVVVLTVAGQQLASVAVDRLGLLRLPRRDDLAAAADRCRGAAGRRRC